MNTQTKSVYWTSAPKLYLVEDKRGGSEVAWITDETLAKLVPMYIGRYSYTLLSVCDELEQIFQFRKDASRSKITQDDIYDALIDLHNMGKTR